MIDLNHILLFIAFISPLVVLLRTARDGARNRSWRVASLAVLAITASSFLLFPASAGFVGGIAWLLFLLIPAAGMRKAFELSWQERYTDARRVLGLISVLHPSATMRCEHSFMRAEELAQADRANEAMEILQRLVSSESSASRRARAKLFGLQNDWNGLLNWSRENIPRIGLGSEPKLLLSYFRALGELGLQEELIAQFSGRAPSLLAAPQHEPLFASGLLMLFAFCGRTKAVKRLLQRRFGRMPRAAAAVWIDRSEEKARRILVSPTSETTLRHFERAQDALPVVGRITNAVAIIIALNLLLFALEILRGGSTNSIVLFQLGALDPSTVLAGQYWRLLSALFLHYGALHLLVNLYALYVIGPPLENLIGAWRFSVCYLLSGFGSSVGVLVWWQLGWTQADLLVGASGAVMGIVGTWAGLLFEHRRLPGARRRLLNLGIIITIQTAFDFATPQVSLAAHLNGLISGLLLGLIIAPKRDLT